MATLLMNVLSLFARLKLQNQGETDLEFIPAPPDIRIRSSSENTQTIEWPTNPTPCLLQETTDFVAANWTNVNDPVSVAGTNATVTRATEPGVRFYRLRLQ